MPQEGITIMVNGYIDPGTKQAEETQEQQGETQATEGNETEEKKGAGELVD